MSDPQVINTLTAKREALEDRIDRLERDLEQARADLSHVNLPPPPTKRAYPEEKAS